MKNIKYILIIFLLFLCFYSGMCPKIIDQGEVNMPEIIQIGHNWCWAASMKAVLAVSNTSVNRFIGSLICPTAAAIQPHFTAMNQPQPANKNGSLITGALTAYSSPAL